MVLRNVQWLCNEALKKEPDSADERGRTGDVGTDNLGPH